jgi:hypothetical protein
VYRRGKPHRQIPINHELATNDSNGAAPFILVSAD